jgi:FSR family fosmidomycin resistance protein-like MFS transporter
VEPFELGHHAASGRGARPVQFEDRIAQAYPPSASRTQIDSCPVRSPSIAAAWRARAARRRAPAAHTPGVATTTIDRRGIGVLALGHLAVDLAQGVVPPLLPFLIADRGYTYTQAGSLLLFSSLGSSLIQPILGTFADRIRAPWLMPLGAALAALGVALVGFMPTYLATGAALGVASLGIAMYHPEGVRYASWVSMAGGARGKGMSFFAVGGMTGWALGPLLVTPLAYVGGLQATSLIAVIPAFAAIALAVNLPYIERFRPPPVRRDLATAVDASDWGTFSLAAATATLRTGMHFGVQAFVPLYVWRHLGATAAIGNATGIVLLVAGAAGTLVGGRLADRIGFRTVVVRSFLAVVPALALLGVVPVWGVFVLMAVIGFAEEMNFYPLVVIAQNALPRHVGFASGVMLGLSIGIGALTSSLLGVLADHRGLRATIPAEVALAAAALALASLLPRRLRA